ncbi:DUF3486 family protein [Synechococcales cyanobacterium C]|uniref:DUF3486 family protein n=1 Tax=Petrachloros mirabilis ULC683 TaxID=2781853 RepID=A0A8K2A784_9CYAN|nr:DUF3486 family protein [Petrachloros mirabilis]NCJ06664.1 DUF3486 family protein [Petrachloros mirabilis ULC683]
MGPRSKINQLPPHIKAEVDQRLITGGFANYRDLVDWINERLAGEGRVLRLSLAGVHRYGQGLEEEVAALRLATEQAKAIVEATPDEEGAMAEALLRLNQQKLFKALLNYSGGEEMDLSKLTRAIADLNRSAISVKKYAAEVKEKLSAKFAALEKQQGQGFDQATLQRVRQEIYGIF